MNSLPFPSHHLFVAAAGRSDGPPAPSVRRGLPPPAASDEAPAVPLAVLDAEDPAPFNGARRLARMSHRLWDDRS